MPQKGKVKKDKKDKKDKKSKKPKKAPKGQTIKQFVNVNLGTGRTGLGASFASPSVIGAPYQGFPVTEVRYIRDGSSDGGMGLKNVIKETIQEKTPLKMAIEPPVTEEAPVKSGRVLLTGEQKMINLKKSREKAAEKKKKEKAEADEKTRVFNELEQKRREEDQARLEKSIKGLLGTLQAPDTPQGTFYSPADYNDGFNWRDVLTPGIEPIPMNDLTEGSVALNVQTEE